mmetsp:Transcript_52444/g.137288  ORF Transcript_52444/g.137288 Transcript_52444/m.137288 type:complete len:1036 (-) Transcript_52444:326-3433(-)
MRRPIMALDDEPEAPVQASGTTATATAAVQSEDQQTPAAKKSVSAKNPKTPKAKDAGPTQISPSAAAPATSSAAAAPQPVGSSTTGRGLWLSAVMRGIVHRVEARRMVTVPRAIADPSAAASVPVEDVGDSTLESERLQERWTLAAVLEVEPSGGGRVRVRWLEHEATQGSILQDEESAAPGEAWIRIHRKGRGAYLNIRPSPLSGDEVFTCSQVGARVEALVPSGGGFSTLSVTAFSGDSASPGPSGGGPAWATGKVVEVLGVERVRVALEVERRAGTRRPADQEWFALCDGCIRPEAVPLVDPILREKVEVMEAGQARGGVRWTTAEVCEILDASIALLLDSPEAGAGAARKLTIQLPSDRLRRPSFPAPPPAPIAPASSPGKKSRKSDSRGTLPQEAVDDDYTGKKKTPGKKRKAVDAEENLPEVSNELSTEAPTSRESGKPKKKAKRDEEAGTVEVARVGALDEDMGESKKPKKRVSGGEPPTDTMEELAVADDRSGKAARKPAKKKQSGVDAEGHKGGVEDGDLVTGAAAAAQEVEEDVENLKDKKRGGKKRRIIMEDADSPEGAQAVGEGRKSTGNKAVVRKLGDDAEQTSPSGKGEAAEGEEGEPSRAHTKRSAGKAGREDDEADAGWPAAGPWGQLGVVATYERELAALRSEHHKRREAGEKDAAERTKEAIIACHERFRRQSKGQWIGGSPRPAGVFCASCLAAAPGRGALERWSAGYSLCAKCGNLQMKSRHCGVCERALTDSDTSLIRCGKSDVWVHARCDGFDEATLAATAAAATRKYLLPRYRSIGSHAVSIGDLDKAPTDNSIWPANSIFGIRTDAMGAPLYGVLSVNGEMEWRSDARHIPDLRTKIFALLDQALHPGTTIHPAMPDAASRARRWGELARSAGGAQATLDITAISGGPASVDTHGPLYVDKVCGLRFLSDPVGGGAYVQLERGSLTLWVRLASVRGRPLAAMVASFLASTAGAVSLGLPAAAREAMLRRAGLWAAFEEGLRAEGAVAQTAAGDKKYEAAGGGGQSQAMVSQ